MEEAPKQNGDNDSEKKPLTEQQRRNWAILLAVLFGGSSEINDAPSTKDRMDGSR